MKSQHPNQIDVFHEAELIKRLGAENTFEFLRGANFFGYRDLKSLARDVRRARELIKGVIPAYGVYVLNGPPGCGKTYFALALLAFIAAGREDFMGWKLEETALRSAYLAYEGVSTIPGRLEALIREHSLDIPPDQLFVRHDLEKLTDPTFQDRLKFELDLLGIRVLLIDTLGAATAGIDEDRSKDMAPVLEFLRGLAEASNALVILVTHPPKGNPATVRGSNTIEGNTDGMGNIAKSGRGLKFSPKKVRTSTPADPKRFAFKSVDCGEDPLRPGEKIIETTLVAAAPKTSPIERVISELAETSAEFPTSEIIKTLTDRDLCSRSAAYRNLDELIPKEATTVIDGRLFQRSGSIIRLADECLKIDGDPA